MLSKLGKDVTETLELASQRWKVVQTVREKFVCRACETISQPPAPFRPIARGRTGPELLTTTLDAKSAQRLPHQVVCLPKSAGVGQRGAGDELGDDLLR